jgi:hypothetical protein
MVKQLGRFLSELYNACFHEGHSKAIQVQWINIKALSRAINRAISDLIRAGEVSAEEIVGDA